MARSGNGRIRKYLHDEPEAARYKQEPGTFTEWEDLPTDTDLLFYEGLHGAVVTEEINVAKHVDLLIGVTPVVNLEWIQKLHRDKATRGYSAEAVTDVILRRMSRLRALHLPAVLAYPYQLPARAGGGYLESVHRAAHPDVRTSRCW